MAMRNRDLIEFQPGYNPYVLKTLRAFCLPKQDVSDRSPLLDYPCVISKVQTTMLDAVVRFTPSFSWTAFSGFQSTRIPFFAQAAFLGFRLAGCTCVVFFNYVRVHGMRGLFAIHCSKYHGSTREYLLNYKRPFVRGNPFASGITLW